MTIEKPSAIPLADSAAVMITRERPSNEPSQIAELAVTGKDMSLLRAEVEEVFLAIGSNLGDRARNIERALDRLAEFSNVEALSLMYETEPQYNVDQPKYYNCAAKVGEVSSSCSDIYIVDPHPIGAFGASSATQSY